MPKQKAKKPKEKENRLVVSPKARPSAEATCWRNGTATGNIVKASALVSPSVRKARYVLLLKVNTGVANIQTLFNLCRGPPAALAKVRPRPAAAAKARPKKPSQKKRAQIKKQNEAQQQKSTEKRMQIMLPRKILESRRRTAKQEEEYTWPNTFLVEGKALLQWEQTLVV